MIHDLALYNATLGVSGLRHPLKIDFLPHVTVREVQERVAHFYNLSREELLSPQRAYHISHPRQVAMYLARELTKATLPDLARRFGGMDHTTIIHGIRAVEKRLYADSELHAEVVLLRERLAR